MATRDDLNTPAIALVGFISALLFFASIILLQVMFFRTEARQRAENDAVPPQELTALVHNQQARLAEYRWVDEKKGVVAVPIDRAMELVVGDLSSNARSAGRKEGRR